MTARAWLFALTYPEAQRHEGVALICPEARYISLRSRGQTRLDRLHASPEEWKAIESQLADRLPAKPLAKDSTIATILSGTSGLACSYVVEQPVEYTSPFAAAMVLDGVLARWPLAS